jgi:hypothetical protein
MKFFTLKWTPASRFAQTSIGKGESLLSVRINLYDDISTTFEALVGSNRAREPLVRDSELCA